MVKFEKGAWVWLEHEVEGWVPVQMSSSKGDIILAKAASGEQYDLDPNKDMPQCNESSLNHVANMVEMEELSEGAILHNLRLRFDDDIIYTYISSILVSMNPFKQLPIYSPAIMQDYQKKMSAHEVCEPHAYALADNAYKGLKVDGENQAVIISGESGAGKTEATKLVLQYMAEMSGQGNDVEQQLLEANPVIEAFGNAKTTRNNNSSRFGKWVQIMFDGQCHIIGAKIDNYLLEKSRIVSHSEGERNYHLFYNLFHSPDKSSYHLTEPADYTIMSMGQTMTAKGIDDKKDYDDFAHGLEVLKMAEHRQDLEKMAAACLHLGQTEFADKDKTEVMNPDTVKHAAELLSVTADQLQDALISQVKKMGSESIKTVKDRAKAMDGRDALIKGIYGNCFDWLIQRINVTLAENVGTNKRLVGVLDIFGFESFGVNRFEQLCINFANEKMQQHFNEHIFTMEQEEYKSDHIDVAAVDFVDNQPCLDLIEKGKTSILSMTDEEIKLPKGSDKNLLSRMHAQHAKHKYYVKPKMGGESFTVKHYAGPVEYNVGGFLEKNKDMLGEDAANCIRASSNAWISALMPAGVSKTVGYMFKDQLGNLMKTLKQCSPHFIRCIKSNSLKVADTFEAPMVLEQLRYLGLKEVINIRQLGYPIRRLHADFMKRYKCLAAAGGGGGDPKAAAEAMLSSGAYGPDTDWRIGDTKVFIRKGIQDSMEKAREEYLSTAVLDLQAFARGIVVRARFQKYKKVESDLRAAIGAKDEQALTDAIDAFEALELGLGAALLKEAMTLRNQLAKHNNAIRGLKAALESGDAQTMGVAIAAAEAAGMDDSTAELKKCRELFKGLEKYQNLIDSALASKDEGQLKEAISMAESMGLDGAKEKQAKAVLEQLAQDRADEQRRKQEAAAAEQAEIKEALQQAIDASSAGMLKNAIERAKEAGIDDPLVGQAESLYEQVQANQGDDSIRADLQAGIDTKNLSLLEATVESAKSSGLGSDPLTVEAEELLVTLRKQKDIMDGLKAGLADKSVSELARYLAMAEENDMTDSDTYAECKELKAKMDDVMERLEQIKADGGDTSDVLAEAAAMGLDVAMQAEQEEVLKLLQGAIDSRDVGLLKNIVDRGKKCKLGSNKLFQEARDLYNELDAENQAREQELDDAERGSDEEEEEEVAADMEEYMSYGDMPLDKSEFEDDDWRWTKYKGMRSATDFCKGVLMGKGKVKQTMTRFVKKVMPNPLTRIKGENKDLVLRAVELFKSIQGFMGDRHYSFPDSLVAELLFECTNVVALRDEVYAQVMKQLSYNPGTQSVLKGWMLLCLLSETFPPSRSFLYHVLNFIQQQLDADEDDSEVTAYAQYCMHTLATTLKHPPKPRPAELEGDPKDQAARIEHITAFRDRSMKSADCEITFLDGSAVTVHVEPWTTNKVLVPQVCKQIGLRDTEGFAIFEAKGKFVQYMYPNECLLDFQSKWDKSAGGKSSSKEEMFVFKRRVYTRPIGESRDPTCMKLMLWQSISEMHKGNHTIAVESAAVLTAIEEKLCVGEMVDPVGKWTSSGRPSWELICPPNLLLGKKKTTQKKFAKTVEKAEVEAVSVDAYVGMVRQLPTFGSMFYSLGQSYDSTYPRVLMLAINYNGVFLLDWKTKSPLDSFSMLSVLGWSSTPVKVVVKVKLPKKDKKGKSTRILRLRTSNPRMGKEICDLLMTYANEMVKAFKKGSGGK